MSAPGVVVVPDGSGPHPQVDDLEEELTMAGFTVEVVDLDATGLDATGLDATGLDATRSDATRSDATGAGAVAAAVGRLRDAGAVVVGAIGFSLGGRLVLRAARDGVVDAVVAYDSPCDPADAARTTCPVQLHLAEHHDLGSAADRTAYVAALEAAGTPVDTFAYPGTRPAVADLDGPSGDPASADVALARTIGFLHARLAR